MNVGILIFPEVETLDFCGPYEVYSVASRVYRRDRDPQTTPFDVFTVAEEAGPVPGRYGFEATARYGFADHPPIDLLVVPGGVVDQPRHSPRTLAWLRDAAGRARLICSVCTGAFLLAEIGLLDGRKATTHWADLDDLRTQFPSVEVVAEQIYVDQGPIVTSAGISAGIDASLHVVRRLTDEAVATATARQMVYDWRRQPAV